MNTLEKQSKANSLILFISNAGAWLLLLVFVLILSITTDTFFTTDNIINVVRQTCVVAIIAIGTSFIVLGGEIDLSLGMVSTFAGCNTALLMTRGNISIPVAIFISLVIGCVIGLATGAFVTFFKLQSFIVSLAIQYVVQGLILVTTNSMPISGLPQPFLFIGRGFVGKYLPFPVILMAIFYIVGAIMLRYTVFGRSVMAVGENAEVAKLSGIDVKKTRMLMFVIGGFCASFAGIIQASRMSSGQPASGADLALQALAAVYIGGTFKGSMLNTLAGALTWGVINNGLNLLGVNAYWQKVALGLIILFSLLLDLVRAKIGTAKS